MIVVFCGKATTGALHSASIPSDRAVVRIWIRPTRRLGPPKRKTSTGAMKHLSLTPALLIAAQHDTSSISSLVMTYRMHGLGGDRACRKLIHRLEKLNLLKIVEGSRNDRREKVGLPNRRVEAAPARTSGATAKTADLRSLDWPILRPLDSQDAWLTTGFSLQPN